MVKVSIILPSLNVVEYIKECLDSVLNQTLPEIEIICVDSGSTDGTKEIIQHYATQDSRVKFIQSQVRSYGYQMNLGLKAASGEYIGIVETDDWVRPEMYNDLYLIAKDKELDLIKADFFRFKVNNKKLELEYNMLCKDKKYYERVIEPIEELDTFQFIMNTWSGIYRRDFLLSNNIFHNETPGASYQDNGFWFQTFALAKRAYFVHKPYYMNRRDNPNSSVYSREKVYCVNEEYKFILEFLNRNPKLNELLMPMYCFKKYSNYIFTYHRIDVKYKLGYLVRMSEEFSKDREDGYLDKELYGVNAWNTLQTIIDDPLKYYFDTVAYKASEKGSNIELSLMQKKIKELEIEQKNIRSSISYRIGRCITFIPRKIRGGIQCYKEHGISYTFQRVLVHLKLIKDFNH